MKITQINKMFFILLILFSINLCVSAQNNKNKQMPDLSGKWVLDKEKSIFSFGVPSSNSIEKEDYKNYTLTINQKDSEIEILQSYLFKEKQSNYKIILFTDKRGEENICPYKDYYFGDFTKKTFRLEDITMKSKTQWSKNKLKRRVVYKPELSQTNHILDQTYELSNDGKTLTVTDDLNLMTGGNNSDSQIANRTIVGSNLGTQMFNNQKSRLIFQKEN